MTEEQARQIIALLTDIKALLEREKVGVHTDERPWFVRPYEPIITRDLTAIGPVDIRYFSGDAPTFKE